MIIAKDLRREVKNWFGSLEPQLFVTHNFGFLVSPETGERSLRRFYNRLQSRVHGRNWNRRDTDQPMIAVGVWEHLNSNPHCHVLISASDAESAWLFGEGNKSWLWRQEFLQPRVPRLKRLKLARLGDVHAAKLRFPFIKRGWADPVLAADLRSPQAAFARQDRKIFSSANLDFFTSVSFVTDSRFK